MNKAYRVVYNETTRTYTAVAEIATAKGKSNGAAVTVSAAEAAVKTGRAAKFMLTVLATAMMLMGSQAYAEDTATSTPTTQGDLQNYFHVNDTGKDQEEAKKSGEEDATLNDENISYVNKVGGAYGLYALAAGYKATAKKNGSVAVGTDVAADGIGVIVNRSDCDWFRL